jgi:hypothetical protein
MTMTVLQLAGFRELRRRRVNLESRKGTWRVSVGFRLLIPRAKITPPRVERDLLIEAASFSLCRRGGGRGVA